MNDLISLLAWRYLQGTEQERNISIMVKICFGGILIGTFALALTLFVMHGFEQITHEKLRNIHAQVIIRAYGDTLNVNHLASVLESEFPQIEAWSPTTLKQAIIQNPGSDDLSNVIIVKAIDPAYETKVTTLQNKIAQSPDLAKIIHDNSIIIGSSLAKELGVTQSDVVTLLIADHEESPSKKVHLTHHSVIIGGIFNTGIDEFDSGLIFCSLDLLHDLWPEVGITQLNLKLKPGSDEQETVNALRERLSIEVFSWKDLYPALVSALKLEKYAMLFILTLIILVASANVLSLSFMHITQKRADIAILQAMGMPLNTIKYIFLLVGSIIAATASTLGLAAAGIAALLLDHYPFITLPDAYYVTHLPVVMEWYLFVFVFLLVMILNVIAIWIPVRSINTQSIAPILRCEG
ncbi:MAG TPA: FtsX-like permease family protein [Candidatus Babeliales bacterium]|nr:FtsX-like permease family protein [Candidatus Babeliales bacterium]